jgi:hypothetical protein
VPLAAAPASAGPAKSADALRATLPAPAEEHNLAFAGDLWEGNVWRGSLRVSVEAGVLDERAVWTSREEWRWADGSTERQRTATLTLGADLSVLQVEVARRDGKDEHLAFLVREGEGLAGTARTITGETEGEGIARKAPWPKDVLGGLGGLALLARAHAKPEGGAIEARWVPTHLWTEDAAPTVRKLTLTAPTQAGGEPVLTFSINPGLAGSMPTTSVLKLAAGGGVSGWTAIGGTSDLLPVGRLPASDTFDEAKPARAWQHAFRVFGVGYHMAKPELVERAFDWQSLYDYECGLEDGWPSSRPIGEFKQAWIDEFMGQSKHRTREETDALLAGTIGTGNVTVRSPDHVVLAAIAQFGGGEARTYQLKRGPDGIWRLIRFG